MNCTRRNGSNSVPQHEAVSISRYREMVETLIDELTEHNPILQKIRNGEAVSAMRPHELAELLHEEHPHITEDLLRQVYKNRKARFIQFIRHILGIEVLQSFPDTVSAAFDQFIRAHTTLSSRQLEFLSLLKNFIIEREKVEKTGPHQHALHGHPPAGHTRRVSARLRSTKSCSSPNGWPRDRI